MRGIGGGGFFIFSGPKFPRSRKKPNKNKGFLSFLEGSKNAQKKKTRKLGKQKEQGDRKKQGLEGQGGVFAEGLRKFCGKSAAICKKYVALRQERVRKFCGTSKFTEICGKISAMTPSQTTP